jgi:hypothetical protein
MNKFRSTAGDAMFVRRGILSQKTLKKAISMIILGGYRLKGVVL